MGQSTFGHVLTVVLAFYPPDRDCAQGAGNVARVALYAPAHVSVRDKCAFKVSEVPSALIDFLFFQPFCSQALMEVCNLDIVTNQLLPVVCSLQHDKIPNIRLNVAKSLSRLIAVVRGQRYVKET